MCCRFGGTGSVHGGRFGRGRHPHAAPRHRVQRSDAAIDTSGSNPENGKGDNGIFTGVNALMANGDGNYDSGWIGVVPEPSTVSLLGLGLVGVASTRRRRRSA
jgi:hypothetical protein